MNLYLTLLIYIQGKHAFKFIVDDEWRFAPDQPTVADIEGRINNFIDVSDFVQYTGDDNYLANQGHIFILCLCLFLNVKTHTHIDIFIKVLVNVHHHHHHM
jgi:hypothetical protein